jgi:hypothetical protein
MPRTKKRIELKGKGIEGYQRDSQRERERERERERDTHRERKIHHSTWMLL